MNPGSPEAHQAGCTCPEEPNKLEGTVEPSTLWQIEEQCPMHGRARWSSSPE